MAIRKIRLTEAQLTRLIGRIVEQTEAEMEEGWLDDKIKDVKRYTTGYADEEEKQGAEKRFYDELDEVEMEVLENIEDFKYEDEDGWDIAKDALIAQAEDNNFLGELEIMYPRRTGKAFVKYHDGYSKGGRLLRNLGSAAGGAARSYQSRGKANT